MDLYGRKVWEEHSIPPQQQRNGISEARKSSVWATFLVVPLTIYCNSHDRKAILNGFQNASQWQLRNNKVVFSKEIERGQQRKEKIEPSKARAPIKKNTSTSVFHHAFNWAPGKEGKGTEAYYPFLAGFTTHMLGNISIYKLLPCTLVPVWFCFSSLKLKLFSTAS